MFNLMEKLFGKGPETDTKETTTTLENSNVDTGSALEVIESRELVVKFEQLGALLDTKIPNHEYNNAVKHMIKEYDLSLQDQTGHHTCEIKSIANEHGRQKWELLLSVFDKDGDGDIDQSDIEQFLISESDHGDTLRFESMIYNSDSGLPQFHAVHDDQATVLMSRVEQFLTHGKSNEGAHITNDINMTT